MDKFEQFLRADELGLEKRSNEKMDNVWEMEKACPVRPRHLSCLTEDQRRMMAKIESLQSSDSPFKSSLESYIDILAAGYGRVSMSEHSAFLQVQCGLTEAQCNCWEFWEDSIINESSDERDQKNDNIYSTEQTNY